MDGLKKSCFECKYRFNGCKDRFKVPDLVCDRFKWSATNLSINRKRRK